MSDLLQVATGAPPWQPGTDVTLVEVLDQYDSPTMVLLQQNGLLYIGRALIGAQSGVGMWLYAGLTEWEASELDSASSAAQVDAVFDMAARGWCVASFVHGQEIVFAVQVDLSPWEQDVDLLEQVGRALSDNIDRLADEVKVTRELVHSVA